MKQLKRFLATAACCALWLSACGCAPWWKLIPKEEPTTSATAAAPVPAVAITVEGGSVEVGDTVILPVTVNAAAHLVNADVFLHYDPTLLEPVLQYDAATDSERYAEPGTWDGTVYSEKLGADTLYVLLASPDDGTTDKGTLFYVAFRLLADPGEGAAVTPDVSVCRARAGGADVDPVAAGTLTLTAGTVTAKHPTVTATATVSAEQRD